MNKKNNRKGFTIVELVIVIAVIAILATVLVPTFSGIITKAQDSAALQEARNIYTNYVANFDYTNASSATPAEDAIIEVDGKFVIVDNSQISDTVYTSQDDAKAALVKTAPKNASDKAASGATLGSEVSDVTPVTGYTYPA